MENIPSLAGQPAFFILNQLFLMREGVRKVEAMAPIVKDLKDDDLDALSEHFAKLRAKPSDEPVDPALAKRGAEIVDADSAAAPAICRSCRAGADAAARQAAHRLSDPVAEGIPRQPASGADTAMRRRGGVRRRPCGARALRGVALDAVERRSKLVITDHNWVYPTPRPSRRIAS